MMLLGLIIGVPAGWAARSIVALLEATDHLPSLDDALSFLDPIWDAWDAQAAAHPIITAAA